MISSVEDTKPSHRLACACQLLAFLIMTDTYICTYVYHENRSHIQDLMLMRSAITALFHLLGC